MKRLFILPALLAAALVLPAAAMATSLAPLHSAGHVQAAGRGAFAAGRAPLRYVPLARTLNGTGTLSGTLLTYAGAADGDSDVNWWVWGDGFDSGAGTTDVAGAFSLGTVPAATGTSGEVALASHSANVWFDRWNMSWPDTGADLGTLQPGRLDVDLTMTSVNYWKDWSTAYVDLYDNGDPATLSETGVTRTGTYTSGSADALPGTLDQGAVYYWIDQGAEFSVAGTTVTSGVTTGSLSDDQNSAQGIWTSGWGSGKPGTTTWLVFENLPIGWTNAITGLADWPQSAGPKGFGTFQSVSNDIQAKRLTIPSGAAVGYKYWLFADHTNGPLSLRTSFQTCSLNASKLTIRKGARIKLSGVVPVKGHAGSTPGITSKRAIIYKTTKSTGQPTTWVPKSSIWTKVATVRVSGLGKFSRYVSPSRTTRYVVRYPGDAWYWGAFTSVRKVTVR